MAQFEKTAREGRENQVYNEAGARLVAGCVPLNADKSKVLMISSSKHQNRWVLPKGGVEKDEESDYEKTAHRESWEEAGVRGTIVRKVGRMADHRFEQVDPLKHHEVDLEIDGDTIAKSEFHLYEMEVKEIFSEWPESAKRLRKWCSYSEAKHELLKSKRAELLEALNFSDLYKDCNYVEIDQVGRHVDQHVSQDGW